MREENELKFFSEKDGKKVYLLYKLMEPGQTETIPLAGTRWKLTGLVGAVTGEVQELEPKDCAECYTLTFETDYKALAKSISMTVYIDLSDLGRKVYEDIYYMESHPNGHDFRMTLQRISAYTVTSNELKIFYHTLYGGYCNYLLFKIIEQ
jgi:hypothetical protein